MSNKIPNLLKRNCPQCHSVIKYSNKYNRNNAEKDNRLCKSCSNKESANKPEHKERMSKLMSGKGNPMYNMTGSLNPFYGKTHTEKTKKIMRENRIKNSHIYQSKEFREKMSEVTSGENNPMHGRAVYDIWLEKYGKEQADIKLKEFKYKLSEVMSGKGNPMYGISPSNSAGSGWSGWYNNWYFRSLRELSYMINVIERFNLKWKSGESKDYTISYTLEGVERTYKPDFIIEDKYMVEIKPKQLHNVKEVIEKKRAGIEFCSNHNLIYKLTDVPIIQKDELIELEKKKLIQFNSNYREKLYEY